MASQHQKRADRQERRTAETYRGSRTAMSGAGWMRKADVRTEDMLIESKTTSNKSWSLKLEDLRKLRKQAIADGRVPVFQVEIQGFTYIVLDENDFLEMINDD